MFDMFITIAAIAAIFMGPAVALLAFGFWTESRTTRAIRRESRPVADWSRTPRDAREAREWVNAYKLTAGCARCGFRGHPADLEFAHRDPATKYRTRTGRVVHPADMVKASGNGRTRYGWDTIAREIGLCEVLCSRCHRLETHAARERFTVALVNGHTLGRADTRAEAEALAAGRDVVIIPTVEWDLSR